MQRQTIIIKRTYRKTIIIVSITLAVMTFFCCCCGVLSLGSVG